MKTLHNKRTTIICLLAGFFALSSPALLSGQAAAALTVQTDKKQIAISSFYHGATVNIHGTCDPGREIFIKVSTVDEHAVLKQKGKVAGFLWMNVGELRFEHSPNFYMIQGTGPVERLLLPDEADRYVLGYPALSRHVAVAQLELRSAKDKWFAEFVRFKEQQRLYSVTAGKIAFVSTENGGRGYSVDVAWPHQAMPGTYTVEAYAVREGKVVETASATIEVEQTGVVKDLAAMARSNGALYGLISIGVALFSGFVAGMIFRKGGGAH